MLLWPQHSLIFMILHFMHNPQNSHLESLGFCQEFSFEFVECLTELAELCLGSNLLY